MHRKHLVLIAILGTAASAVLYGQEPLSNSDSSAARVAAIRFALSNGVALPAGDLVVARERTFQIAHPSAPKMDAAETESQASALVSALGRGAKTGSVEQLLFCRNSACAPTTKASVILVDAPRETQDSTEITVYIRVYSPGVVGEYDALFTHGVVVLVKRDGVWVGSHFKLGPSSGKLKLPAK